MTKITESEKRLIELTREHISNEQKFASRQDDPKVVPIDDSVLTHLIMNNSSIESKIRELCSEVFGPLQVHDQQVREQLIKIRDGQTETKRLFNDHIATLISHEKLEKILGREEYENILTSAETKSLDDMIEYLMSAAGYSGDFENRKKEFGTIFIERPTPENLDIFLQYMKDFFLLNMHPAVIGFSRLLIEIACVHIYDRLPEREKRKDIDMNREARTLQKIRRACNYRLRALDKKQRDMIRDKAVNKYRKASEILHGKLPEPKTEEESLEFIKDVFSIIEALY